MARELGGKRCAMFIAAAATAVAPISLGASALFQYVSFDYLWFVLLAYFVYSAYPVRRSSMVARYRSCHRARDRNKVHRDFLRRGISYAELSPLHFGYT